MQNITLSSSAVLVDLSISVWTGRKQDKQVSNEIDMDKATLVRAGRYHKDLLAGSKELDAVNKYVANTRLFVNKHTLPWNDTGTRLVTTVALVGFNKAMEQHEQRIKELVAELLAAYPTLVQAASFNLGGLFNPDDYPSVDEIGSKFRFRISYSPVPEVGDFRVDVGNEQAKVLREQYERVVKERVAEANRTNWENLYEVAARLSNQLRVGGKVYDSTFNGLAELCEMLKHMNIAGDRELEERRKALSALLDCTTVPELRKDEVVKKNVKADLDDILSKFSF